jgi:transposase
MQFQTLVVCRVPRSQCPDHGVLQLDVPWGDTKSRFTLLFERFALDVLSLMKCQSRTARILALSPSEVHGLMHRAVKRGLDRRELTVTAHISLDEKSFHRGHVYGTVLTDVLERRVLDVTFGRDEESARKALASLPEPESVKTITIDMHQSYINAAAELPHADVIHDRFHIAMNLNRAVDEVRRRETAKVPELKNSRYIWLKNPGSRTESQQARFNDLIELELKTTHAYALKQVFRSFFEQETLDDARAFFQCWFKEVHNSGLTPMRKAASMLARHHQGILNYVKHKLTNGYAEAVNGLIQEVKTIARGFRRFENFKIAILFFLGKLDLYPRKCS